MRTRHPPSRFKHKLSCIKIQKSPDVPLHFTSTSASAVSHPNIRISSPRALLHKISTVRSPSLCPRRLLLILLCLANVSYCDLPTPAFKSGGLGSQSTYYPFITRHHARHLLALPRFIPLNVPLSGYLLVDPCFGSSVRDAPLGREGRSKRQELAMGTEATVIHWVTR